MVNGRYHSGSVMSRGQILCQLQVRFLTAKSHVQDLNSYESTMASHSDIVLSCGESSRYHRPQRALLFKIRVSYC